MTLLRSFDRTTWALIAVFIAFKVAMFSAFAWERATGHTPDWFRGAFSFLSPAHGPENVLKTACNRTISSRSEISAQACADD